MKIYILADMEGISGIRMPEQVQLGAEQYVAACALMMADMNAAIDAAFAADATEVVACDTHGGGGQIKVEQMDPRATYEMPGANAMMPALDESFAGVVLLGHHAMAGTRNGFLDHTMSSGHWFEFRVNGQAVGEIGIEAAYAAHFNVPVIAVSGDDRPDITRVDARTLRAQITALKDIRVF
jgi:D-amino peptidase